MSERNGPARFEGAFAERLRISGRSAMKVVRLVATGMLAIGCAGVLAPAQAMDEQKLLTPQEIKWGPAPSSIPPGAQAAVLYGDPAKDGSFVLRLKLPKDYHIPPHTHPKPEIVTVISGTLRLGMAGAVDRNTAKVLPAERHPQSWQL